MVFSTQNGDNFLAGSGTVDSSFGPAITWNKAVAMASGSSGTGVVGGSGTAPMVRGRGRRGRPADSYVTPPRVTGIP